MKSFDEFLEGRNNSSQVNVIMDLANAIKNVFAKYTMSTREDAWDKLTSKKGRAAVMGLVKNPSRSLAAFREL